MKHNFTGVLNVVVNDKESNEVNCDTHLLGQRANNLYEIINVEIPLYEDAACTCMRSGVVGLLLQVTESGREYLRIVPTYPGRFKAGYYVTHGPFENDTVDETWYRDLESGEICNAWTGSTITIPKIIGKAGTPQLVGISILPNKVKTQIEERRTLKVIGSLKDGSVRKEIDLTSKAIWKTFDAATAFVKDGVLFPKRLGRTKVECEVEGFVGAADILIGHYSKGERSVYFQGVRRLQQIRFDAEDNLYFCNQSSSIYQIARGGGFQEVIRVPIPDTYPFGIDCIAIDSKRNLYANNIVKQACLRFSWDGKKYGSPQTFATVVKGNKNSIVLDPEGHIFVAVVASTGGNGYIIHVAPDGKEEFFPTLDAPIYLALDRQGNIYTPSRNERAIHVYTRNGEFVRKVYHGIEGGESDIFIDLAGAIYLPFFYSGQLYKFVVEESQTKSELIAEGFQAPGGLAMDSQGHIYISNFGGNSIDIVY